jgi:hypothetical protein
MANDWFSRPHIKIHTDGIRRSLRKPRQPPTRKGRKNAKESGKALIEQLEESVKYCNRPEKIIANENTFFILRTESAISFEENLMDRFGLHFSLQIDDYSAVVTIEKEFLDRFHTALKEYAETSDLHSYIDEIQSISIPKFDRISPQLHEWLEVRNEPTTVEVEVLPNLGTEQYTALVNKLVGFVREVGDEVLDSRIRERSASFRGRLKPQTVKLIVHGVDSVWQARPAPKIIVGKPQRVSVKETPIPKSPEPDAKSICVLDTGIDLEQPFLKDVMLDAIDLTSDNKAQDTDGHGTFVAGLAAYGVLENRSDPEATARLISAKILGKNPSGSPYLESLVEQAVNRFHERAKIFTLSIMYPECCEISQPTELAYTIDKLSREHDVLFTVCTGNVIDELPSLMNSLPYPTYLGDARCKILSGAEACMSVTVGGVAEKESDRSIARKGQPSPFTRRGEIGERNKPDVVASAGNIEQGRQKGEICEDNTRLGIASLALSPDTLAYDIGTSYAAPMVANLLARLSKTYPEAGSNLLKALLIHFARIPDEHSTLNMGEELKRSVYGKGVPDFLRCAYSTSSCATYILEDSIGNDEIAWVPIYVPEIMRNIYGEKRMRVTLVYDPPVDRGVVGYSLVDLDFRLYKRNRIQRKWENTYRRAWDNAKTDVFRWQKSGWGEEWSLMIFPKLRFKKKTSYLSQDQRYGLVISLEDPSKRLNIYDAIISETRTKVKPLEAYAQALHRRK